VRRRGPTNGDELLPGGVRDAVERAAQVEHDEPAPALASLLGERVTLTTETPPWLPPDAYPFAITWWPLSHLGHDEVLSTRAPLLVLTVERPGPVELPGRSCWTGSVCICVVYADGATEWVGP